MEYNPRVKIKILSKYNIYDGALSGLCYVNKHIQYFNFVNFGGYEPKAGLPKDADWDDEENWYYDPRVFKVFNTPRYFIRALFEYEKARINLYTKYTDVPLGKFARRLISDKYPDMTNQCNRFEILMQHQAENIKIISEVEKQKDPFPIIGYSVWSVDSNCDINTDYIYGS
jgi:hypothetical protein